MRTRLMRRIIGLTVLAAPISATALAQGRPDAVATIPSGLLAQHAYLKSTHPDANDAFGTSVAVFGDTVAIGAPYEDGGSIGIDGDAASNARSDSGAVFVFVRRGTDWIQEAYIKASNAGAGDRFGHALALSEDLLVVSAVDEDSGAPLVNGDEGDNSVRDTGAVYVFARGAAGWSQEAYIKSPVPTELQRFGWELAVSGDSVAVGVPTEFGASGAVHVYERSTGAWVHQAGLQSDHPDFGDLFGVYVSLCGETLVVGAHQESGGSTGVDGDETDNSSASSGAAYVFERSAGTWAQTAYLKASNPGVGDLFGLTVSISGDTIAVGAETESSSATGIDGDQTDDSAVSSGAVYVFERSGPTWVQTAYIKASNTHQRDYFGSDLALSGDRLIVSAWGEDSGANGIGGDEADNSAPRSGAAYLFERSGGAWSQTGYLKASNSDAQDHLLRVALSGRSIVLGAADEDGGSAGVNGNQASNSRASAGAAYVIAEDPCSSICDSLPNATGLPARISCIGEPTSSLTLVSAPVPNTAGQFFHGPLAYAGITFGDGLRCVGGSITRMTPILHAGMMAQPPNAVVLDIDYAAPYASGLTGVRYFQHWFRSGLTTGAGFNVSDGVAVTF